MTPQGPGDPSSAAVILAPGSPYAQMAIYLGALLLMVGLLLMGVGLVMVGDGVLPGWIGVAAIGILVIRSLRPAPAEARVPVPR